MIEAQEVDPRVQVLIVAGKQITCSAEEYHSKLRNDLLETKRTNPTVGRCIVNEIARLDTLHPTDLTCKW